MFRLLPIRGGPAAPVAWKKARRRRSRRSQPKGLKCGLHRQRMDPVEESSRKYRQLRRLGGGGMAEVFSAEMVCQTGYSKMVAVKRVLPHLVSNRRFIHMFLDEARLGLLLNQ